VNYGKLYALQEEVFNFIKNNPGTVTDLVLKKNFKEKSDAIYCELHSDCIDPLIYDNRIERFYPPDSQVPVYCLVKMEN
jgi:hypothetical protein